MSQPPMTPTRRRARSQTATERDNLILESAIKLTARSGWDAMNFKALAEDVGLSRTPLYSRFVDNSGLAIEIWKLCSPDLLHELNHFASALLIGDTAAADRAAKRFIKPNDSYKAAAELMMASIFDSALNRQVQSSFAHLANGLPQDSSKRVQIQYAWVTALGFLLAHKRGRVASMQFDTVYGELIKAFGSPAKPIRRPILKESFRSTLLESNDQDEIVTDLLKAVLEEVAERGYAVANVRSISRRANMTEGVIYSRFSSKLDMFLEATRSRLKLAFENNISLSQEIAAKHTAGVAQAMVIFEAMRVENGDLRAIRLEQLRLGWHSAEMKSIADKTEAAIVAGNRSYVPHGTSPTTLGEIHWAFGLGLAVSLIPELLPSIAIEHFEVVTIPLYDGT